MIEDPDMIALGAGAGLASMAGAYLLGRKRAKAEPRMSEKEAKAQAEREERERETLALVLAELATDEASSPITFGPDQRFKAAMQKYERIAKEKPSVAVAVMLKERLNP